MSRTPQETPPATPARIDVVPNSDLQLNLHKHFDLFNRNETFINIWGTPIRGTVFAQIHVLRAILISNSTEFMSKLVRVGGILELEVPKDVPGSSCVEITLRALHGTLNDASFEVTMAEVWEVIRFCDMHKIDHVALTGWAEVYLKKLITKKLNPIELAQAVFPLYTYSQVIKFARVTFRIATEFAGIIKEENPTDFLDLHCPHTVFNAINAARGGIRTKILDDFELLEEPFIEAGCKCSGNALKAYKKGLRAVGLSPFKKIRKSSIMEILNNPGMTSFECETPAIACPPCRKRLLPNVLQVWRSKQLDGNHANTYTDFQGLCIHCMTISKTGNIDSDYWQRDTHKQWDRGCGWRHGQNTWYYSFIGNDDVRKAFNLRKEKMKEGSTAIFEHMLNDGAERAVSELKL